MWNSVIVGLLVGADSIWSLIVMLGHRGHKAA
ncbi:hypothetical protein [Marinobacterium aestuariivivens]|uniref:DUF475 domain-containing protein n=1 Tax=Marinobacterium aestuariivivens TaxID=1698799 RepID=A0ABW2AAU6_9GAMM